MDTSGSTQGPTEYSGDSIVLINARERAAAKLKSLIARFGDADGARLTAEYMEELVKEELMSQTLLCMTLETARKIGTKKNGSVGAETVRVR